MFAKWVGRSVRSRFYKYFISYVLIIVTLLIVVGSIVYENFIATLKNEVQDNTVATLSKMKDAMDLKISELNRMALQIPTNSVLTPFMVEENGFALERTVSELKKYRSTNMFIRDVILYYPSHPGRLYAASGIYDTDLFFNRIYKFDRWDEPLLKSEISEMKAPSMRPMETVLANAANPMRMSVYVHPLMLNRENRYGAALFLIEESAIQNIVRNALQGYDGFLYILNEKNEPIYNMTNGETWQSGADVFRLIVDLPASPAVDSIAAGDDSYSVIRIRSDFNNWSYITVMPTDQFMGKVERSRQLFEYTIASVFLLGLIMAFGFSLHNYRPLQRLMAKLSPQYQMNDQWKRADEFDMISNAVGRMSQDNEGLLDRLKSQANAMKEQYLLSLLYGKIKRDELDEALAFSHLKLDQPYFVVLLFLIDDFDQYQRDGSALLPPAVKSSLLQMIEELSLEAGYGYGVELPDNRGFAMLLNASDEYGEIAHVQQLAAEVKLLFQHRSNLSVTVGIGDIYDDMAMTYQSYMQAWQAAKYRFVKGGDRIICFCDLQHDPKGKTWHLLEQKEQIALAIKQGKSAEAEAVIGSVMNAIGHRQIPLRAAELICFDIINTMIKTFAELEIQSDETSDALLEHLILAEYETMEELESMLCRLCRHLCSYIGRQTESKQTGLSEKVLAYVSEHYCDGAISLESISGLFGLSPSYVTRVFKEQTGHTLMRYIDTMRMNKAKQLLKNTDVPLKEIIEQVGYVDPTNFIRKFKKSEGVTPIQYRTITKAGGQPEYYANSAEGSG